MKIVPVILSGGAGTRLWPLSREMMPKQFLPLVSENTMIQETLLRLDSLKTERPIVICNEKHRFIAAEQISSISANKPSILLEPVGKNTAPAISVCAFDAMSIDKDAIIVVLPSDHVINDKMVFLKTLETAVKEVEKSDSLVTFGIVPDCPHTGYGYIKKGKKSGNSFELEKFVEKPEYSVAKQYFDSKEYLWNSGMFVFRASTYLSELSIFNKEMYDLTKLSYEKAIKESDFTWIDRETFEQIKGDSIDYAVMEHTKKGKVIPLDAGWNDVGSWSALWEISPKDIDGNAVKGTTNAILHITKNCYINSKKRVATLGVSDLVIVEGDGSILVASKDKVQYVKKIVDLIK